MRERTRAGDQRRRRAEYPLLTIISIIIIIITTTITINFVTPLVALSQPSFNPVQQVDFFLRLSTQNPSTQTPSFPHYNGRYPTSLQQEHAPHLFQFQENHQNCQNGENSTHHREKTKVRSRLDFSRREKKINRRRRFISISIKEGEERGGGGGCKGGVDHRFASPSLFLLIRVLLLVSLLCVVT